jgi:hypothetical protein
MKERGIRSKLYRSVLAKALKHNPREVCFPSFETIRRVGLLICEPDLVFYRPEIDRISKMCSVELILYSENKRQKGDHSKILFSNDLNWIGIPRGQWLQEWLKTPFDILINLNHLTFGAFEYICATSVSKFKAGAVSQSQVYDLIIQFSENQKHGLIDAVLGTIKRLKSNH